MPRLGEWLIGRKEHLVLLAAFLCSLSLLFANENAQIRGIRAWTLDGFGFLLTKLSVLKSLNAIYEKNERLRLENAELMIENSRLYEALLENQRLRDLLGFKSQSKLNLVPAKVIGKENNGLINSIILDAGGVDDLQKDMAVVTAQGLVGKIFNVGTHQSISQLLLDRNFRVSAMIQRSRVMGIIRWSEGNQVFLAEVPKRSDVRVGDVVVTSGFSTIFPGGLEIGHVTKTTEEAQNMFMNILVKPAVDFSKLEEVFVVRSQAFQSS